MALGPIPVARAGIKYFIAVAIIGGLVNYYINWLAAIPVWALLLLIAYLFRDPERDTPSAPLAVISPVDGVVVSADEGRDPFLDRDALCIDIKMSILDCYVSRSPTEGRIQQRWFDESTKNLKRRIALWIQTDEKDDLVFAIGQQSVFKRPRCHIQSGDRVGQGKRCGYVKFGAPVQVYIAPGSRIEVKAGERVVAGETILGYFVHRTA